MRRFAPTVHFAVDCVSSFKWNGCPNSAECADKDRKEARRDVFDAIEMFYKPKRRHGYSNRLSPVEHEPQCEERFTCA
jgi:hypothetical protein